MKNLVKSGHALKLALEDGTHTWQIPLYNRHTVRLEPPVMMPGTAAYAITPPGAQRLITRAKNLGWEQSDHFINTHNCDISYCSPGYFDLGLPNLRLSHGLKDDTQ